VAGVGIGDAQPEPDARGHARRRAQPHIGIARPLLVGMHEGVKAKLLGKLYLIEKTGV